MLRREVPFSGHSLETVYDGDILVIELECEGCLLKPQLVTVHTPEQILEGEER
jgi:hypothetical protein